ncbi:hypothetical protein LCGC14_1488470 [marine sediment metagenome]|uniref:Helix-turn-helix domain-containing protein n=1 Tax=marine sediment metagenome TaxID=412755 RepID=A0A0F9M9A2_9ZZZZ
MEEGRTVTILDNEFVTANQAALLIGMDRRTFISRAKTLGIRCIEDRDARGKVRSYRLGDVLDHRLELGEREEVPKLREQRDRCILALYRTLGTSLQAVAEIVGGITRQRVHGIIEEQQAIEAEVFADVEEAPAEPAGPS